MQPAFRLARKKKDRVPKDAAGTKFEIPDLEELTIALGSGTAVSES